MYDQSTYSSRQNFQKQLSSFENVIVTRNYQRFSQNDNFFYKKKILVRFQKNIDKYNQQTQFSNYENDQNTQFLSFEIFSIRNQKIFV